MFADYTYFRADGASLTAIEMTVEARDEVAEMKKKLAAHFGASDVSGGIDKATGRFTVSSFRFDAPKKKPQGWVEADIVTKGVSPYGMPAPGSSDHFYMLNMAGLIERAAKRTRLEDALKSGEMPWRDMVDGQSTSPKFVRYSMAAQDKTQPAGELSSGEGGHGISGGDWKTSDPLAFLQLEGYWYIRVPNIKGTETPVFTPADAVKTAYKEMLSTDAREHAKRFNDMRASTFEGYS